MEKIKNRRTIYLLIYYLLLLAVLITWQDLNNNPPILFRLFYFGFIVFPLFFSGLDIIVPIFTLFYTLARDNYTPSYLPTEIYTYILVLIALCIIRYKRLSAQRVPLFLFFILILVVFRNLLDSGNPQYVAGMFFAIMLSIKLGAVNDAGSTRLLSYAIIAAGVVISFYHILHGQEMATSAWLGSEQIDRIGFKDINYSACIIALAVCSGLLNVFSNKTLSKVSKYVIIGSVFLMMYSLIVNASRGSLLAVAVPALFLLLFSKNTIWLKIIIILLFAGGLIIAYRYGLLDYVIARIQNEDGTGTGRVLIWNHAFKQYIESPSSLSFLVGYGYISGRGLVAPLNTAFHNDFLAFLVEYGFIGLILFLIFFFFPIFKSKKENRIQVIAALLSLFVICMTLEPFAAGRWAYFGFWLFAWSLGQNGFRSDKCI